MFGWNWGYQCKNCEKVFSPCSFSVALVCPKCGTQLQYEKNCEKYLMNTNRVSFKRRLFQKPLVKKFLHGDDK